MTYNCFGGYTEHNIMEIGECRDEKGTNVGPNPKPENTGFEIASKWLWDLTGRFDKQKLCEMARSQTKTGIKAASWDTFI